MIEQVYYYIQNGTNPYENLALERLFLESLPTHSCLLYLWQNRKTVVIGRNQNAWQECKLEQLERDGGSLARRLSGGGAVFHDLGNLNFTFILEKEDYDIERQLDVLLQGLRTLGVQAVKSGRNDLLAEGRKFSGNAYYESGNRKYHHGTLMVDVDRDQLSQYLQVSHEKLIGKGVTSVQSRVVNLKEIRPTLTIDALRRALVQSLEAVYGMTPMPYEFPIDEAKLHEYQEQFASKDWLLGHQRPFGWEIRHRFSWGEIHLQCRVEQTRIKDAVIHSDAMDGDLILRMADALQDCDFQQQAITKALSSLEKRQEIDDFCRYLDSIIF